MDRIRKFKNLISIVMLYAANMIVHDKKITPQIIVTPSRQKRITGTSFMKLTTSEKI